jgi:hypothetical protein
MKVRNTAFVLVGRIVLSRYDTPALSQDCLQIRRKARSRKDEADNPPVIRLLWLASGGAVGKRPDLWCPSAALTAQHLQSEPLRTCSRKKITQTTDFLKAFKFTCVYRVKNDALFQENGLD